MISQKTTPKAEESCFASSVKDFLQCDSDGFVGRLTMAHAAAGYKNLIQKQTVVWKEEFALIEQLCNNLLSYSPECANWWLIVEYPIPRRQKRPDLIVLASNMIFVIEFKFNAESFERSAQWQVQDYALDLRDFHSQSKSRTIVPILVATMASKSFELPIQHTESDVSPVQLVAPDQLSKCLWETYAATANKSDSDAINPTAWINSAYRPTLSIIEAAESLFAHHSVRDIAMAASENLTSTVSRLVEAIEFAQKNHKRVVCFVTGVPGSGKTLTGLSAVHDPVLRKNDRPSGIFLSGNGPLVNIVREALARDAAKRQKRSKKEIKREVSTFIQNIHMFLNEYGEAQNKIPFENVVVFDEAQRAWNAHHFKKKKGVDRSEAALLFDVMERLLDWCVIIALVGSGQEIHDGEGGLSEWAAALQNRTADWLVIMSPEIISPEFLTLSDSDLNRFQLSSPCLSIQEDPLLHLSVSLRNVRSQHHAEWVEHVINCDERKALETAINFLDTPVMLTRDLDEAKKWLKDRSRSERRAGLVASSGSLRHRAYGLELSSGFRMGYSYEEWFVGEITDLRVSNQLEVAATEFECQGLELDLVCLCWGDDLCVDPKSGKWLMRQFKGKSWNNVKKASARTYLLNKYRVLLTRGREGLIIWVPPGSPSDPTRPQAPLDATAEFLLASGAKLLLP